MEQNKGIRFRAKVGWWIYLLLAGIVAEMVWMLWVGVRGHSMVVVMTSVGVTVPLLVLLLPGILNGYCLLTDDFLLIRMGVFSMRIRCDDILLVQETYDPTSSMALSFDRVGIEYSRDSTKNYVLVAVCDKDGFFKELQARNPTIEIKRRKRRV